ncbi:acyltransferase family protein [Roseateles sp. MS654]|uniref:acyltransferase family protein n=1 Tax=Roseateles sp. MS654 TaxID=3412685 RepID=UPI003C2CCB3F
MEAAGAGTRDSHVGSLDGLRGLAAIWVFLAHAHMLSGMRWMPVLTWGDMAVDLFMMISGFLMAHNYLHRRAREPWTAPSTWQAFWLRRFFRIAPCYYLLLAVAMLIGPWLHECRELIAVPFPNTATPERRYLDTSLANIAAHVSFVFGALPDFAFRTALPDWSIGLEMQFYAVFPLLMLFIGAAGRPARIAAAIVLALGAGWLLRGYGARFEMPAFLGLKLHIFLIGIVFGYARFQGATWASWALAGAIVMVEVLREPGLHSASFAGLVLGMGLLVSGPAAWPALARVRGWLAAAPARLAGEYAYCLYLIHLLWLIPIAGLLTLQPWYLPLKGSLRFLTCVALTAPPSFLCCALIYRFVEQPGIRLGKRIVSGRATPLAAQAGSA